MVNVFEILQKQEILPHMQTRMSIKDHLSISKLTNKQIPKQIYKFLSCHILIFSDKLVILKHGDSIFVAKLINFICCNLNFFVINNKKQILSVRFIARKHKSCKLIIDYSELILFKNIPIISTYFRNTMATYFSNYPQITSESHNLYAYTKKMTVDDLEITSMCNHIILFSVNGTHNFFSG